MLIKNPAKQLPDGYLDKIPLFQFLLLSLLFPMWGAAAGLNDILITQFKHVFALSDAASAFVQSAFYGGYFVIAIPASRIIRRTSYKVGVLIGLAVYIIGCALFFPASTLATYGMFLFCIFAIAIGLSFLETSANTYSSMLGPKQSSTLRLNISQTFTPIGNLLGVIMGKYLIFSSGDSIQAQMDAAPDPAAKKALGEQLLQNTLLPYKYILVVLICLFILFLITEYPKARPTQEAGAEKTQAGLGETLRYLSRNKPYLSGIVAQFLYVGLQTAVWSFTIRLALTVDPTLNERSATNYMIAGFACFLIGKLPANFLMAKFSAARVLIVYCIIGAILLFAASFAPSSIAIWFVVASNLLMGPGWPTIFGKTLDTIEDKRYQETGGAVLVMAIVGGAIVPVIQGWVSDQLGSLQRSFVVSALCFLGIMVYFVFQNRLDRAKEARGEVHA
ncbi:L-fucose:H+ symporter permease [Enemella evansiae]|uniref:L-fucose:H+ symporter permease n=1 Tax=Enemella evansiae TaxID=2016499 RepID=A0A255G8X3_9ACTN|nr:L-fucose:H+ symporter permease [Enemella evansiae]PFG67273.1 FHS family L-fucose permease-like MFS transporter [Propionibacteriaceae bacterium ES.041]OYN98345.1 L-fucose:H+ symporter permease [Enemella evansiae]OYN99179.1 L-fucose:H+ symporter permease [Enemella evansiae]OYO05268.1 L-fucose:H+ symporter permease [Enemella evansiae]OYO10683.1 L-fucose:H+ symporter permease [Enemella evansiae]